mmetsp:Transcript_136639/g.255225  ORF Transcript_136639/g.255225 Transcript_136639/m.255225 type:complete len:120 (-) Transcript_136639:193-552(-)
MAASCQPQPVGSAGIGASVSASKPSLSAPSLWLLDPGRLELHFNLRGGLGDLGDLGDLDWLLARRCEEPTGTMVHALRRLTRHLRCLLKAAAAIAMQSARSQSATACKAAVDLAGSVRF